MKKIVSALMVAVLLVLMCSTPVFADSTVDYETLYMDYAMNVDNDILHPFRGTSVHGLIMVDLKGDGVPLLITYATSVSTYDENGEEIYSWDSRYNDPKYQHVSHSAGMIIGIKNGEVVEYEPTATRTRISLPYLPFESTGEVNKFCGFATDENNVRHFLAYDGSESIYYKSLYITQGSMFDYDGQYRYSNGEIALVNERFKKIELPYAYVSLFDFEKSEKVSRPEAMRKLLDDYKLALGGSESPKDEPYKASDWAVDEITKADELGLIPDSLTGADLTGDITRAEFAAVSVKVYEALSGTEAAPVDVNPFWDTEDAEILKAYHIGAVAGTSETTYEPNALLNREQAATMLTRVFKKVFIPGWTFEADAEFSLPDENVEPFADDADISDWAKESVYFMVGSGIIRGMGDNKFAPKNVTSEEEATGYANATREQALLMAVRMVESLNQ